MMGRRRIWKTWFLMLAMLFTVVAMLLLFQPQRYLTDLMPTLPKANRAVVAPDFALRDLDGNMRHLESFRGRVVLLTFWTTWCPPCQTEMPLLEALYRAYRDRGFEVVAVVSDVSGAEVVQLFATHRHLSFTILQDTSGQVTRLYGVTSLPTSYLLDQQGRLVTAAVGNHDWAKAEARALIVSLFDTAQRVITPQSADAM